MQSAQVFHPETISRKGERNAWLLAGVALVAYLLLWRISEPSILFSLMVIFLLISAFFISLSNWVDRKTTLILEPSGVEFHNGLRKVHLNWKQIEKVGVTSDRWGSRVHVSGTETSFNFRMFSEVKFQGKVRSQMGFHEGETILKNIIQASGLSLTDSDDQSQYYARP